jgi:hypothetical protein
MQQTFWLDPRDKVALFIRVMKLLAAENTRIMLEGRISPSELPSSLSQLRDSPPVPRQAPEAPQVLDMPLTEATVQPIARSVAPRVVRDVAAIQIIQNKEIQFMVGDNFHRECVSVGPAVPESFLSDLLSAGIIRGYTPHRTAV